MSASSVEYTIGGVRIQFPCKAYPSQLAMMNSILRGLNNGQHCLLESPTGSGKSLALLCSALGWQQAQYDKMQADGISEDEKPSKLPGNVIKSNVAATCQCPCHSKDRWTSNATSIKGHPTVPHSTGISAQLHTKYETPKSVTRKGLPDTLGERIQFSDNADQDKADFLPKRKRIRAAEPKGVVFEDVPELESYPSRSQCSVLEPKSHGTDLSSCLSPESCFHCPCTSAKDSAKDKKDKRRIPKIFLATRTHKQITQIVHEMKRTAYSNSPMTILSSRDHTCVNSNVAPHPTRNELCKDLLEAKDGRSCRYYHAVHKMGNQRILRLAHGFHQAWDIEELVSLGKRLRSCSYYAARALKQESRIIFCPYNYLLDPMIRESMEIDLAGHILVLDEAHNIEDCARESASFVLDHNSLLMCRDELDNMVSNNIRRFKHEPLRDLCYSLVNWIQESQILMSNRGYEETCKVWSGKEILTIFHTLGITSDSFQMLKEHMAAVLEKEEVVEFLNGKEEMMPVTTISSSTSSTLKGLFMVLDFLYRDNCRYSEDYRVALQKTYSGMSKAPPRRRSDVQGFMAQPGQRFRAKTGSLTLSFWCLNPAVAFSDISSTVHSIVLTSGTLSPMGSFSSELGVKFSIQLEANHVINKSQVWVGTVGVGPQGRKLCATFQHAETYAFQDEVGALLLHVCKVVPKGVLCFFPSYTVELKMKYNDQHYKNRGLLSGHHWYEIQAYRALNQALGRCIRHRGDWGALILVDDRYRKNPDKYIKGLSKWIRQLVQHHATFTNAMQSLIAFSQLQLKCHLGADHQNSSISLPSTKFINEALLGSPKPLDFIVSSHTPTKDKQHELQEKPSDLTPSDNPDEKEEDQAVSFTPELFQAEASVSEISEMKSPTRFILGAESMQNPSGHEFAQNSPFDEKSMLSVNTESIVLSGNEETNVVECGENVRNKIRLSRSRQRAHFSSTDK
ncbi:Fanconi anemia group J protein isoform X2 [Corythoichthys intestinalis]|uniref:Fanconi anemia group J protein isoform X2 n=1 Tax=Corythoichthys intestinalis TaxID=161448 RepID=UPI0025A65943|nr:Fanconi anemia group J protein isoform X2 [Corythoichthys intestinalis]